MKNLNSLIEEITNLNEGTESDAFNHKLAEIQNLLGVKTGDLASHFFDDTLWLNMTKKQRNNEIKLYIKSEVDSFEIENPSLKNNTKKYYYSDNVISKFKP